MNALEKKISEAFRSNFENHPDRKIDVGSALEDARNDAAALLPAGVHGAFDDATLTFEQHDRHACE